MLTSTTRRIHGYNLHTLEAGSGEPVFLLHGFAQSAEEWLPTLHLLAQHGYRAIAVDALGFGKSDKPTDPRYSLNLYADLYNGLMIALGLKQATFVAHSFGGKLALATALLYPTRVNRLVLVDSEGFMEIPFLMKRGGSIPFVGKAMFWLSSRPALLRAQLSAFFYDSKTYMTQELLERALKTVSDPQVQEVLIALSRCYDNHDLRRTGIRARLNELRCPTLIIWGQEDRVFPLHTGQKAQSEIPGAQLVAIPRCGHFPQVEAFHKFHGLLLGFLAGAHHQQAAISLSQTSIQ